MVKRTDSEDKVRTVCELLPSSYFTSLIYQVGIKVDTSQGAIEDDRKSISDSAWVTERAIEVSSSHYSCYSSKSQGSIYFYIG